MKEFKKEFGKGFRAFFKVWGVCINKSYSRGLGFVVSFTLVLWACNVVWEIIQWLLGLK